MDKVIDFLVKLEKNNNRDWYLAHKDQYEESRKKMLFITELLIAEIRRFDGDVPAMDPGDCLFRIYRDVRFSSDKRPYKTHFGSYIARGGRKSIRAGYYFHIEPGGSFLGGGIYMPNPPVLKALRTAIFEQYERFRSILEDPAFKIYFPEIEAEKLKSNPRGYEPDFEHMYLLRYKWYAFSTRIDHSLLPDGNFLTTAISAFQSLYPVNKFLNDAIDNYM